MGISRRYLRDPRHARPPSPWRHPPPLGILPTPLHARRRRPWRTRMAIERDPRFLAAAVLAVLSTAADAVPADRRPDPSRLTVAVLNARFLFDGREPEGEGGFPWKGNAARAREHLRDIAELVRTLSSDLIHISEVEDLETLERLALEVGDPTYRAYLVPGRDDFTRQNVGLLSRIDPTRPLFRTEEWSVGPGGGPAQGVPKHYAAVLPIEDMEVLVVGIHLLAFPSDPERAPRRESQAEVLRRLAVAEGSGQEREVVVLGDFNDFDPEVPDVAGNVPISRTLETVRALRREDPTDDLGNAALRLAPSERYSAFHDANANGVDDGLSERSLTDHILLSPRLHARIASARVLGGHDPLEITDHFPLEVTLDLAPDNRCTLAGDANGDGAATLEDAIAILRALFEGEPAE